MKRRFSNLMAGLAAATSLVSMPLSAAGPTSAEIQNDAATPGDVLSYGMGPWQQRFSTLDKLNSQNVAKLVPAFASSLGGEKQRGQESQPIVYDGTIYVTGSYSRLFAFDARTGEKKWEYNARLPDGIMPCCDVVNRGAAIHGDKVIFATLDARLIALDRHTGKVLWNKKSADYQAGYSATAAPLIVKDMIITGNAGGEFGVVGAVQARNVDTGELIWERPVIEGHTGTLNGQPNGMTGKLNASWTGDTYKTGGGATWLGGTYDPGTNLVYFGTGNPGPWNSHLRPGDNLYTASTLAIDADTGVIKWHYQTTPHDGWDFDGVNEFIPFDTTINGKAMKLGAKADRNGYFYVLDRTNGKLIGAHKFVMQTTWANGINLKTGRPNFIPEGRPGAPNAAEKGKSVFASPSFLGGKKLDADGVLTRHWHVLYP
jgi:alcohol dehydrogenase (cytochrome c)